MIPMDKIVYRVSPIPDKITRIVRETLVSPQYKSLAAVVSVADGYGPCRSCLRLFDEGSDYRIFFTYNSFEGRAKLPDPGPVFIHKEDCVPYSENGFPGDLLNVPLLLEAFGDNAVLLSRVGVDAVNVNSQIEGIFADSDVRYINLRNREAGCFVATIERVTSL